MRRNVEMMGSADAAAESPSEAPCVLHLEAPYSIAPSQFFGSTYPSQCREFSMGRFTSAHPKMRSSQPRCSK